MFTCPAVSVGPTLSFRPSAWGHFGYKLFLLAVFPLNGSLEGPNRTNFLNVWRITFSKALTQVPSNTHATYTWSGPDVELPDLLVRCKKKISQTCSAATLCCWPNTQDFHINSSIKQDMSQLFEVNYKFSHTANLIKFNPFSLSYCVIVLNCVYVHKRLP